MEIRSLCLEISMPDEAAEALCETKTGLTEAEEQTYAERLTDPSRYADAAAELQNRLGADENGMKLLRIMLLAALRSAALYEQAGIPHAVFADTMRCFSRFVGEHRKSRGAYGFDRGFWTGRQLSLLLFRLGSLEFERVVYEGRPALSVHIPSDADLDPARTADSFARARAFFARFYPEYANCTILCNSWLLSPALPSLLSENSKIIRFQRLFRVVEWDKTALDYKIWVYQNPNLEPKDFPEHTSLQRNIKRFVLDGGSIGEALGIYES